MRKILYGGAVMAFSILFVVTFIFLAIKKETRPYLYDEAKDVPHAEVAIILGAALTTDGGLSSVLRDRVDAATLLYKSGKVKKILASGDNGTADHNEVSPVREYLLGQGVSDSDIFLDYAGFDTYSSMYRAKHIFLVDSAIVVSQEFHLSRALFLARHLGLAAYGFSADKGSYRLSNYVREYLADTKAIIDLAFHRKPKYLGEVVPVETNE